MESFLGAFRNNVILGLGRTDVTYAYTTISVMKKKTKTKARRFIQFFNYNQIGNTHRSSKGVWIFGELSLLFTFTF